MELKLRSKHLSSDDPCPPPPEPNVIRIYSMLFCPFVQRVLLVAISKGISVEIVNINVTKRPGWLLRKYPGGKVPILETSQGVISESLTIAEYLDQLPSDRPFCMARTNIFARAQDKNLAEQFQSVITTIVTLFFGEPIQDKTEAKRLLEELAAKLEPFNAELKRRGTRFFGGDDRPGMLDYMIWPFVERFPMLELLYSNLASFDFKFNSLANFVQWCEEMKKDEAVQKTALSTADHFKYVSSRRAGNIDYDFLME